MVKAKHVLGISGGKDSAALAIYLFQKYPQLDMNYYFCDTGKELEETYLLIQKLEIFFGKTIEKRTAVPNSPEDPFDHFFKIYRGYLPSSNARWCTQKLKLEPFEEYIGNDPVVSYVGIRGDEDREGYISRKINIQSIFPFRKNIWSEDVIDKIFNQKNQEFLRDQYAQIIKGRNLDKVVSLIASPLKEKDKKAKALKLDSILDIGIADFNKIVFEFLKSTDYPLSREDDFPLLENEDVIVRDDVFKILEATGIGVPAYYKKVEYNLNGQKGEYARSRSGCYFCFFQQKIEWVWLYEQHPELYKKAMAYENDGFTWNQHETLEELIQTRRIEQIKKDHLNRTGKEKSAKSKFLIDILDDSESTGCAACFI